MGYFLLGAISMACAVIALFFLRFWRRTGDRLFAIFAAAFAILGLNWVALGYFDQSEGRSWLYIVRLIAFGLIILGILDKNRSASRRPRTGN